MLSLISFILVCIGCLNWFSIGILQFDFVAGIFGSQSNIFSRIIYTLVGIASIIVAFNLVKNKGKFVISFKKTDEEFENYKENNKSTTRKTAMASTESAKDNYLESSEDNDLSNKSSHNCKCGGNCNNKREK